MTDSRDLKIVSFNQPSSSVLASQVRASAEWIANGTVNQSYIELVLGDPAESVIPNTLPPRILTEDDLANMDCPYPPEPGYE